MAEALLEAVDKAAGIDRDKMEAIDLLAQGKRNLLCGEVLKAVNELQEACRRLASKFGETADECAEVYFYYGKALLELSRIESGVLGNALQGIEEDEADEKSDEKIADVVEKDDLTVEEKEKISDEVLDAMLETDEEVKARLEKEKALNGEIESKEKATGDKDKDVKTEEKGDAVKEIEEKKENKTEDKHANKERMIVKEVSDKEDVKADKDATDNDEVKDKKDSTGKKDVGEKVTGDEKDSKKDGKVDVTTKTDTTKDKKTDEEEMDTDDKKEGETSQEEGGESEDIGDEESEEQEGTEETEEGDAEGETKGEGTSEKKEEEDVSNLQLAWEMLELSKIIFKRNNTKEAKLKLADSFLNLGEVGMETEQYETAISDFKECLRLQMELLDADDRAIAETYYQLGLACTFHALYDEAVDYYRKASSTIETRIANLKKIIEGMEGKGKEKADPDDPLVKAQKEVKDLEDIIPDIMAKIEDVLDEKRNADQMKQLVKDNLTSSSEQTSTTTTGFGQTEKDASQRGAVKDITHLVRKRKKVEDDDEDTQKKAKTQENGTTDQVNGTAELNGKASVNGQANKSKVSAS